MKNTGKKLGMYSKRFNWNFTRTVWEDEDGIRFVKVNGCRIDLDVAMLNCDSWAVVR